VSEQDAVATPPGLDGAVELSVPADSVFVSVLRTVTASLAARRDFTIEEIDDLRIAVDEAGALLLPLAAPTSQLTAHFSGPGDLLEIVVSISPVGEAGAGIDQTSFAWLVLAALADEVSTSASPGQLSVALRKRRGARTR
jgi:serine/threonine-protein kinase RsbW